MVEAEAAVGDFFSSPESIRYGDESRDGEQQGYDGHCGGKVADMYTSHQSIPTDLPQQSYNQVELHRLSRAPQQGKGADNHPLYFWRKLLVTVDHFRAASRLASSTVQTARMTQIGLDSVYT